MGQTPVSQTQVAELMARYGWLKTPYPHQLDAFNAGLDRAAYAYFAEQGTGKSIMVLMLASYLYRQGKITGLVIVAPGGMYRNWGEKEIPEFLDPTTIPFSVGTWMSYMRKDDKERLQAFEASTNCLKILSINIESFVSERALTYAYNFIKIHRCMMVIDESTSIKNHKAKRTQLTINLGRFAAFRRVCSGNPMPNGPMDLYSQTEFLGKNLLGFANFFAMRNRFAVIQDLRFGNRAFKQVVGYKDLDSLKMMMRKFAFIIKKEDCLKLPPKIYQEIDVEMGPKQAEAYEEMRSTAMIQLESGSVTATMVITQLLRLHQIACGFLAPDKMEPVGFAEKNNRMERLLDSIEYAGGKAIIWCTYRYNIKQVCAALKEKYGDDSVAHYFGDTTADERLAATKNFQDPNSPVRFIVANPASGKFGLTWTAATTVIYYSNDYDLEARSQSEDRAHRIGQEKSVSYIDLKVRGTVDEKILKVLKAKKKLTDEIVASNWKWILGLEA